MARAPAPNKAYVRNRRIVIVLFCLVIGWVVYGMTRLHIEAWRNTNYLNEITILDGRKTVASAQPNGDLLTGSSSPAYAEFAVDDTLENLYVQTMANLKRQGYSGDGYADTSGADVRKVAIKVTKGSKSIVLEYGFAKPIVCDETNSQQKPCYFDAYKDVYTSGLKDTRINMLKVSYDNN